MSYIYCWLFGHDWNWYYADITFPTSCKRCRHNATDEERIKYSIDHEDS